MHVFISEDTILNILAYVRYSNSSIVIDWHIVLGAHNFFSPCWDIEIAIPGFGRVRLLIKQKMAKMEISVINATKVELDRI